MKHLKHLKHKACNMRFPPFFYTTQRRAGEWSVLARRRLRIWWRGLATASCACAWRQPLLLAAWPWRGRGRAWRGRGWRHCGGWGRHGDGGGGALEWATTWDGGAAGDGVGWRRRGEWDERRATYGEFFLVREWMGRTPWCIIIEFRYISISFPLVVVCCVSSV